MRLIDADKLIEHNKTFVGNVIIMQSDIEKESTVEAIPIEWIKEHYGWLTMANEIIDDWSKENV